MRRKPVVFHLYMFSQADLGNRFDKCGSCNWETERFYWLSTSRKEALEEINEMNPDEAALLCGECMAEMLYEENYQITKIEGGKIMSKKLTKKQLKELREFLARDILNRYDNLEYWNMDLADNIVQDWGISDKCSDEIYKELRKKKVKIVVE